MYMDLHIKKRSSKAAEQQRAVEKLHWEVSFPKIRDIFIIIF